MKGYSQKAVGELIDFLAGEGYLAVSAGKFPLLGVSDRGIAVLQGREQVWRRTALSTTKQQSVAKGTFNLELFEELRTLRLDIAKSEGVPPFMIFSDASLKDMTRIMPLDEETFLEVSGVGQVKLKKYGHVFLEALNIYNQE